MNGFLIAALRAGNAFAVLAGLFGQFVVIPTTAADEVDRFPRDAIFTPRAFRWVDVIIGASVVATVLALGVAGHLTVAELPSPDDGMDAESALVAATAGVAGPHFEALCREYVLGPGRTLLDTSMGEVGCGVVTDSRERRQIQIDVAVVESGSGGGRPAVALLGEAKWGTVMGTNHLERLQRARELLAGRGMDTTRCGLACFSAAGFSDALREEAERGGVLLIGLDELYGRTMPTAVLP
ncbi:hypothetical protein GCM10010313_49610 [Streptomyces violarus]|uniref:Uncharacterized protein n=1 Tax=Streptomyces violarus TaxID=67380 RepID=A0A7W4ZSQ7_9ACTN|nr:MULTISPECIES: DUF2975 domain-containing protein [Streptomyces]MBB3077948.1 hypothetical protein [Streptomyces violarus]WRT99881.1 DUF2975 domain-containing protein [Streptomyces sp. CGMCC 4.1772]GHD18990.1 hypothetical protein GCM10010313_49610 [Streptomyces violarus]